MKRLWLILAAVLGLAATSVPALADLQYTLNIDSAGGVFTVGNFGTVTLHQTTADIVKVTVQLNTAIAGMGFANTSAGYAIAWDMQNGVPNSVTFDASNVNNADFSIQPLNGAYKASPFTSGGGNTKYQYAIDYAAANGTDSKLVFDVTRSTGLALTDFIGNPDFHFASDIITTANATRNVAAYGTGVTVVPEPRTWLLFLAGLLGLTLVQRRRKLARA